MLGQLIGKWIDLDGDLSLIRVGDVGYEVRLLHRDLELIRAQTDQTHLLWTHLICKEDRWEIFGFLNKAQKHWFRKLIKISSVGGKIALAMLDHLSLDEMVMAVHQQDPLVFSKTPGVGKRMAAKVLLEMELFVKDWVAQQKLAGVLELSMPTQDATSAKRLNHLQACLKALAQLGYRDPSAATLIQEIQKTHEPAQLGDLIRLVLQRLDRPGS